MIALQNIQWLKILRKFGSIISTYYKRPILFWERLSVGTVPTVKMHPVGTVPTIKMHPVGTVPTVKMHPVGTVPTDKMHPVGTVNLSSSTF